MPRFKGRKLWGILSTVLLGWGALCPPESIAQTVWSRPIRITEGGTYTGNWRSTDPSIPAVKVETSQPVTIQNCQIESVTDGIFSLGVNANLTITNCQGQGLNPNIANRQKGFFINVGNFSKVIIERNTAVSFAGIRILNYSTGTALRGQIVGVRYNSLKNVDGRLSNGQGGYLMTPAGTNAVGLNSLSGANVEIAWNQVINKPYESNTEDMISTYASGGTADHLIDIHDNYLQGGYAPNPSASVDYSGVTTNLGDAPNSETGYTHFHNNQVVSFENSGVAIYGGHDNEVDHNRVLSAQKASDGTILGGNFRNSLNFWDYYDSASKNWWYNNSMHDNAVNVVTKTGTAATPLIVGNNVITGTSNPWGHLATQDDELKEYKIWLRKLTTAGIKVGCWSWKSCKR
jgi:hypothetical protein